eukprot:gb/GEZJ01004435.1/.p1 GENE.gb/GEZJ01004435.1/~~gb/GEZJ01004435.1/.p1  ORF type:complete len:147 (-),score=13.74 gb/GEZJ01004435.1/:104-544(-)
MANTSNFNVRRKMSAASRFKEKGRAQSIHYTLLALSSFHPFLPSAPPGDTSPPSTSLCINWLNLYIKLKANISVHVRFICGRTPSGLAEEEERSARRLCQRLVFFPSSFPHGFTRQVYIASSKVFERLVSFRQLSPSNASASSSFS